MDKRQEAIQLLTHYLTMIGRAAGVRMDSDTDIEIAAIVDAIIAAARTTHKP